MGRADFMREHFHHALVSDEFFFCDFEKAVGRTFERTEREFAYDPLYGGDYSSV